MSLTSGTRLGPYEVIELIGAGGMGEVYRAHDTRLNRDVALKVLPETFARDTQRLARFEREAKLLPSLNHPNITAIYGLEESGDIKVLPEQFARDPERLARFQREGSGPRSWRRIAGLVFVAVLLAASALSAQGPRWFSAWTVSHNVRETSPALSNSTVRMIVRPMISGNAVRIKLENTLGQSPVTFSEAHLGVLDWGAAVLPGTNQKLSFNGGRGLTLAPGAGAWSDPLNFDVRAFQRLVVSLAVASASDISTHTLGLTTNYYAPGSRAAEVSGSGFTPIPPMAAGTTVLAFPFYWLAAVDVASPSAAGTIVAFGDSITDGRCSTTEKEVVRPDWYQRWTDVLAARLASLPGNEARAVANEAIAGNRIISGGNGPPGLERIDRDVLERAGATHVIVFEGTNDITGGATAAQVIAGTQQIIERVHARGLSIIGVTIIPRGRPEPMAGWTPEREAQRLEVNAWIRNQANFDGIIDFDRLMTGGPVYGASESIQPEFNCDYTHPNAAGYKAMGEFVDLSLFRTARGANSGGR